MISNVKINRALKEMGYTIIRDNRHVKVRDRDGNIRVMSKKYLTRCINNPRFFRTLKSNRTLYFKNKKEQTTERMTNGETNSI